MSKARREPPDYVLFTDADIAYEAPDAVERLVRGAEARGAVLDVADGEAPLREFCRAPARPRLRLLLRTCSTRSPGSNDPRRKRPPRLPAAACSSAARRSSKAGGLEAIRGALIDDCALGALMKRQGPIWLGLTERVVSLRPYPQLSRHPPHGGALGLRRASLFAVAARRHARRHGAHLSRAAAPCDLRATGSRAGSASPRGLRWRSPSSRCSASIAARRSGGLRCRRSPRSTPPSRSNRRSSIGAAAAAPGRAASRRRLRRAGRRLMITATEARSGKGTSRREFSRRVAAHPGASIAGRSSPSIASCAPPTTSPTILSSRAGREARDARQARRGADRPRPRRPGGGAAEGGARRARPVAHAMRSTCSTPFAWTRRSCATPTGASSCTIAASPPCRSAASCSTCTASMPQTTWPASDAICAALQVINHLQDCADDYRNLDRVYLPLDALSRHARARRGPCRGEGERGPEGDDRRSRGALARSSSHDGAALADLVADTRLAMEIAAIRRLAVTSRPA